MACVWAFLSGKGGTGKSTVALCAAAGLAREGQRVALVDADAGVRNLDLMLGVENRIVFDMLDVIEGEATLEQALCPIRETPGLWLLCASQVRDPAEMSGGALCALLGLLRERFDHVLVDCPTGIGAIAQAVMACADEAVIVTTPDDIALRDADRTAGLISQRGGARAHAVVNRVRAEYVRRGLQYAPDAVAATLDAKLLCAVPEDEEIRRAALQRRLPAEGEGARALASIAAAMLGRPAQEVQRRGLFSRFSPS